MKFLDWLKKTLGGGPSPEEAEGDPGRPKKQPDGGGRGRAVQTADGVEGVPGHRRKVVRDKRLLKKPPPKNYWDRPDPVMSNAEAQRSFSTSFRTRNREIRSLMVDAELLREHGLPIWTSENELAGMLGISVRELWWYASHRYDDSITHYVQFRVPKRSGGHRVIMAPKKRLKTLQQRLNAEVAARLPISDYAHGFLPGRSVRTNAEPHVGRRIVMRFDLEDFFGTVTFGRVRGLLLAVGYPYDVSTCLALLMTEAERQPVEIDGELNYVPVGHRYCPQGAPTSPAICNAIACKLDHRLAGLARSIDWQYTRYADDMTFSGDDESKIGFLLRMVDEIVGDEGFALNASKTRVMRSGSSQRVTGVTVNETLGLSRKERRRMRARLHRLEREHEAGSIDPAELDEVRGRLAYLHMLNPDQAEALRPDWL